MKPQIHGKVGLARGHGDDPGARLGDLLHADDPPGRLEDQVELDRPEGEVPFLFQLRDHLVDAPHVGDGFALRDHDRRQPGDHDRIEVLFLELPVDPDLDLGPAFSDNGDVVLDQFPGRCLFAQGHGVFEIQDDAVRAAGPGLFDEFSPVGGNVELGPADEFLQIKFCVFHELSPLSMFVLSFRRKPISN